MQNISHFLENETNNSKKKKKKKKKTNLKRPVNKGEKILLFSLQKKNLTVKLKTVNFLSGLYAIAAYRDPQC